MPYATATDIQNEFKNLDFSDPNGALVTAEITEFISQEEAVINATISNRYLSPVTGTESTAILKKVSIAFVGFRVAKILNLKKNIPIPEKFNPQSLDEGTFYREAKKTLDQIRDGSIVLNDATARSLEQGVKSYNATNAIGPLWERDTKQW